MTGELQRISCTGGGAREQGLLRVDDSTSCRVMGQERQHAWGLAKTPSGQCVGPYQTDVSNEPNVSKKSIQIIVDLFFYGYFADTYPTSVRYVSVSDTYLIWDTSLPWRIGVT